jgi:hypothetical protein
MARHLELRPLTRGEQHVLRSKLRDLTLSVRVHQRYRVIDQVRRGFSLLTAAERVGCTSLLRMTGSTASMKAGSAPLSRFPIRRDGRPFYVPHNFVN